jgi:hypothetical protein
MGRAIESIASIRGKHKKVFMAGGSDWHFLCRRAMQRRPMQKLMLMGGEHLYLRRYCTLITLKGVPLRLAVSAPDGISGASAEGVTLS